MPIRVKCGNCKKTLSVKDHLAGKKIKCPVCQSVVVVSAAPSTKTPTAQPPPTSDLPKTAPQAPAGGTKKPVAVGKPAPKDAKTATNGKKPAAPGPNGKQPAPAAPEPPAPPSEEIEAEAAALFADQPPPVVEENPGTIDFKCEWCEVELHFPLDMGGKRTQCTNEECRRLVKVPMPKVEAKKDWRKMDRQGPASARINQPDELDNAWGTENTTRARQGSLEQAGAIEAPPKPPLGVVGILGRIVVVACVLGVVGGVGVGGWKLFTGTKQNQSITDAEKLVKSVPPKVSEPVLAAEVHRTIALLYLQRGEHGRDPAAKVQENFQGARYRVAEGLGEKEQSVNEKLFLVELALSQIKLGGSGDEVDFAKTRQSWDTVRKDIQRTLEAIQDPEVQAMGVREVTTRILILEKEKKQSELAINLTGALNNTGSMAVRSQHIALLVKRGEADAIKEAIKGSTPAPDLTILDDLKARKDVAELNSANGPLRIGFAEGHARKDEYEDAEKIAKTKGPPKDRLEACVGIAAVALADGKKESAVKFVKEGIDIAKSKDKSLSPWALLFLAKYAARTAETDEAMNGAIEFVPEGPYRVRAQLEVVQAKCDKATGPVPLEILADLEASDKEGTTLALAWYMVAQQYARNGMSRSEILKAFNRHATIVPQANLEMLLPLAEIGSYHRAIK